MRERCAKPIGPIGVVFRSGVIVLLALSVVSCSSDDNGGTVLTPGTFDPTGNWQVTWTPQVNQCSFDDFVAETVPISMQLNGTTLSLTNKNDSAPGCETGTTPYDNNLASFFEVEDVTSEFVTIDKGFPAECLGTITANQTDTIQFTLGSATSLSGTITQKVALTGTCQGTTCPGPSPNCECTTTYSISGVKGGSAPNCTL